MPLWIDIWNLVLNNLSFAIQVIGLYQFVVHLGGFKNTKLYRRVMGLPEPIQVDTPLPDLSPKPVKEDSRVYDELVKLNKHFEEDGGIRKEYAGIRNEVAGMREEVAQMNRHFGIWTRNGLVLHGFDRFHGHLRSMDESLANIAKSSAWQEEWAEIQTDAIITVGEHLKEKMD